MEEFRKIANYEYSVSKLGNVRNDMTNKMLKPGINSHGYYYVILFKNGKMKNMRVHRLVIIAFIANPDSKPCIDHIDNSKINNNINNLRWVTHTENSRNRKMNCDNSSNVKGVSFNKKSQKWQAQIMIDGIAIHLGFYKTIEEASIARLNKVEQVFGKFANKCEGINHGVKPMKIRKPKRKNILKKINQIYEEIFKLRDSYKKRESRLQKQLLNVL